MDRCLKNSYNRCFCWNGDDDTLKECIKRSEYVKNVRNLLKKKKYHEN